MRSLTADSNVDFGCLLLLAALVGIDQVTITTSSFFVITKTQGMCCHQSRDIPTPGFPKLPQDGEKHNPGVVFGSSICWA